MDIDRVRYFCVFANMGSLIKASEILRISQPALSKALKILESETGLKLIEREGRGLALTAQGMQFHREAEPLLQSWLSLGRDLQKPAENRPFRIGSFEVFTTYFLGPLLESDQFASLDLHEFLPGRLEEAIDEKVIDLGITYVPIPRARVVFKEATRINMGVFGHKSLKSKSSSVPFVIPIGPLEGTPSKVIGLDGWPDHEFPRKFAFRVALMQSALEICSQGKAVSYLPEFVVRLYNQRTQPKYQLVEFPCPIPKARRKQSIFIVQRQGDEECRQVRAVAKALRSL